MDPGDLPNPCPSKIAAATMAIVKAGQYRLALEDKASAVQVKLEPQARLKSADRAVRTLCTPHSSLAPPPSAVSSAGTKENSMNIMLFDGTSFEAASWLADSGASRVEPCVLDFASDSEPGGGWKGKQRGTQEEGLCRCSNLGVCLEEHYESMGAAAFMPNFAVVYCPDIVVFRDCRSQRLVEKPFWVGVAAAALRSTGSDADIRAKVNGVLRMAGNRGHRQVVLGAWGCGAFGNNPETIAEHMLAAVHECRQWFDQVVFAVPSGENFEAFHAKLLGLCDVVQLSSRGNSTLAPAPAAARLTEQHKWELLSAVSECMEVAIKDAAPVPDECKTAEGARRTAAALLVALKTACLAELATCNSTELVTRLGQILIPLPAATEGGEAHGAELTDIEEHICAAFQDAAQEQVIVVVKQLRRSLPREQPLP